MRKSRLLTEKRLRQVRSLATERGYRLHLWNGLNATLYRLDNPLVRDVAGACSKSPTVLLAETSWAYYHTLVIKVADARIAIVYFHFPWGSLKIIEEKPDDLFAFIYAAVYDGVAHYYDRTSRVLEKSILNGVKPAIGALVF